MSKRKEIELLKENISVALQRIDHLAETVIKQQEEINELKKPKEPEYFG